MGDENGKLLRVDELAERLSLKAATLRKLSYQGKIPVVRVGARGVRYRYEDVAKVLVRDEPARRAL